MKKRLLVWCVLALLRPDRAWAQFTDPHQYDNTPVGLNQVEVGYAFVHGNASLDPSVAIADASLDLNQGIVAYSRYFGLFDRPAWVEAAVPVARLGGSIIGTPISAATTAFGDSSYALAMLLSGGSALDVNQFDNYSPTTALGVSLSVTAPTGRYDADKVLNLGSDRWSFKPEIALSVPFGREQKWQLDSYGNVYVFTDNTSYRGHEILRQAPLAGLEEHISYSVTERVWISFDTRYSFRGSTSVDGVDQNNRQQNVLVGGEMNVALDSRHSLQLGFAKAVVHQNSAALTGFNVKYDYAWNNVHK